MIKNTGGTVISMPFGKDIITFNSNRHFFRGENQQYLKSVPSLRRRQEGKSKYECELIKGIALMRSLQFAKFIWKIDVVPYWEAKLSDINIDAFAQHYGFDRCLLDLTNDFRTALFFAGIYLIVLRHLLVGLVEHSLCPGILDHTGLEVVRCEDAGDSAKIPVGVDMAGDPGLLLHIQKGLCVCIAAVWQHRYKQICFQPLPGVCVHQSCRLASPVHLHGFTRLVFQMHGSFGFVDIVRIILVELGGFVGQLAALTTLLAVFHPQKAQGDAALLHLSVHPLVVWHLVLLAQRSGRIQFPSNFFCAVVLDLAPGKILLSGTLQSCYDSAPRTAAAFCDASVVDSQTVKTENLLIVGHEISSCNLDYILRCTSIIQGCLTGGVGV